ncbi:hypothetical protein P4U05_15660 [Bacillus paranthracis]|uniref:hypothetical protein n=1 Tax=Bacillus TaxID=1386 RepID=UPI000200F825|nr:MULTISPECIES: hypothetical protein [Bacillus]ADY23866.1 hypothetical protein YBT020_23190 [Bacillus thuringiensis serovar finitimus YBT-020]MDA1587204.1 hypothetical protein [Bacillus cereus group sp. TH230-1LC]MRC74652.1 hypothetical protein [Bacillus thuringiensis]OTX64113.1 hypothetical protein BK722_27150 [Bacillus thuringiensis serovar finitimus]MCR6795983.1 hypothetical protein [Bacillus paranthracis]
MSWKMKCLGIISVFFLALVGCQTDKSVETTPKDKAASTDSKSTGTKESEGGEKKADSKSSIKLGKVEKQLGKESFTNFELDEKDERRIYLIADGDNLGVLFEKDFTPYFSSYSNGKWQKDKKLEVKSMYPEGRIIGIGEGYLEVATGEKEGTLLFLNYKGEVVFKEQPRELTRDQSGVVGGRNSRVTSSSKGNVIIHQDDKNENERILISQRDGKEIMKLDGVKDFPPFPGYLDFDKKLMFQNKEIYDFGKKKFVYDTSGQKLEPDRNGKVVGSDGGKYFFVDKSDTEKSNGLNVGKFDLYEQKLGPENERENKTRFTGPYVWEESIAITNLDNKIYYYSYYKFEDKPAIYMTEMTYKNNKSKK